MTTVWSKAIRSGVVLSELAPTKGTGRFYTYADSVVPESNIILLPLETDVVLLSSRGELIEIVDYSIRLRFRDSNNSSDKARIEEYGLPSGNGICAYERMLGHNWLTTHCTAQSVGSICLDMCRMQGFKTFQVLLHTPGQKIVDRVLCVIFQSTEILMGQGMGHE
jgi:hypothetical protein